MGRMIDGDALMELYADRLTAVAERYSPDSSECGILSGAMKLLEIQPTVEERKWIPVSERLPDGSCSDLVNVSIHDDSGDTPFDYTSCGWVTTDGEYWIVDNEINNHVIAWMSLPQTYKESREEHE